MFEDDSPIVAGKILDPARMKDLLHIDFVGPDKRSINFLMKKTLGSSGIKARAYVIYQWLTVLSLTHQYYDELDYLNEIEYPEVQQVLEEANQDLINSAATSTTEVINGIEESA
eukprot:4494298-Ditylum_brightwellii.AAC.1